MARLSPLLSFALSALVLLTLLSGAHAAKADGDCEVDGWQHTASPDFCCLPGFFFEQNPPNRTLTGPACTMCGPGTHACAEDGCCNYDPFCFRDSGGLPRCSSMQLRDGTAAELIPAGVVLTGRVANDPHLDRVPTFTVSPGDYRLRDVVLWIVVSCFAAVGLMVVWFTCACCIFEMQLRAEAAKRAEAQRAEPPRADDPNPTPPTDEQATESNRHIQATLADGTVASAAPPCPSAPSAPSSSSVELAPLAVAHTDVAHIVIGIPVDATHEMAEPESDMREPLIDPSVEL